MLIYSMSASVDGFIADRRGEFAWTAPSEELARFHFEEVAGLGAYLLGRRLYETMQVWETDPALSETEAGAAFAAVWSSLPKVVFSRTLSEVGGTARLATGSVADEVATALRHADGDVSIGGAALAAQAIDQGLVDEFHLFRCPVVVGAGTLYFPPTESDLPLELISARAFDVGVVYEQYARRR